ncbi:NCS1 nucleoside transporter [Xylariales sp. PMI_506]|nr:NCS1 nucleoside transporter [Xylariales sp. PMI_506]
MAARSSNVKELLQNALKGVKVEEGGIQPVPLEEQTSTRYFNAFTVWCSMNTNALAITFGMLGTASYGLSLPNSTIIIVCFSLLATLAPAYLSTFGPSTGMRQMVQARYSFGYYLVYVPVLLNIATLIAFCVIICVVGGECLTAVSGGTLSPALGIVLIAVLALVISFWGFNIMHFFESYAWMPALVAIIITVGCGGSQLRLQVDSATPTAAQIIGFGGVIASYMIPYACIASDLTTYFNPTVRLASARVFVYSYLGLFIPAVLLMILGAAIGGAIANVPEWEAGYDSTNVGGVLAAMLAPAHGFGKFILVVHAFGLLANTSSTMYAITLNFQLIMPIRLPRYIFSIVVTAILIPVSIRAATNFFDNVENLVSLIGYWSAAFVAIVLVEHHLFRQGNFKMYDPRVWDIPSGLPSGIAALTAGMLAFGLVIPCIAQVWWTGPIAESTGDLGFEVAFVLSALLYVPLRFLEKLAIGR